MTDAEKKMNKEDLKHYKDYDTNIRAMVIGLQNSPEPKRRNANNSLQQTGGKPQTGTDNLFD